MAKNIMTAVIKGNAAKASKPAAPKADKPTNAARKAAEKLAAELAAAEAAKAAAEAETQRKAVEAAAMLAASTAPVTNAAPAVTKVADDVFGNRLNSWRCRAINTAILKLAGPDGKQSFKARAITAGALAADNGHNAKHIAEFGVPIKAISNHVRSLVVKRYLVVDAETGLYSLSEAVQKAVSEGKAK